VTESPTEASALPPTNSTEWTDVNAGAPVPGDFVVTNSVHQLLVSDADPGLELALLEESEEVARGIVDDNGFLLFRQPLPGDYTVGPVDDPQVRSPGSVLDPSDVPAQALYDDQVINAGFGYIETRDGTLLSANVELPGPIEDGPYPTVMEYSGYGPSDPSNTTFSQIYSTLGYAYVGVNVRGSGCSNGAYGFFETVQTTDGYDVIEALAAQPWVQHGHVGMVGISYPGISQLFVAQTQPPHLAAITPLSVLDDSYRSTLYPGGILNTGFAVAWSAERQAQAEPYGQEWTIEQANTDPICAENQLQRGQNQDLLGEVERNPFYDPALGDPIAPRTFVDRINVPVFIAGAWQDEQTGGHWPAMLDQFTGTDHLYVTAVNGLHTESLSLGVFGRYVEFLDLYVAKRTPSIGVASVIAPVLAGSVTGIEGLTLPQQERFAGMSYEDALAAFEAEPSIRVLFEEGAAEGQPALSPLPRFTAEFDSWPVDSELLVGYLSADGTMTDTEGTADAEVSYVADPDAVNDAYYEGSSSAIWRQDVVYDWQRNPAGTAAVFTGAPLAADTVVVGSGWVELFVEADAPDTDLEVTISEITSDGNEVFVQAGWLRASGRAEDGDPSGPPSHSHLRDEAEPLPAGEFTKLRVELFPVAHPFRAGSQIRLTVDAPGGNRPVWAFDTISDGEQVTIATGAKFPSQLVLPTVSGVDVPAGYPACGTLRGQPCRPL
jgi:uncharacterized protein